MGICIWQICIHTPQTLRLGLRLRLRRVCKSQSLFTQMILHFLFAPLLLAKFFGQGTSIKTNIVPGSLLEFSAPKNFSMAGSTSTLTPPALLSTPAHSSYLVVLWSLAKETCAWKSEIAAEMSLKSTQRNTHPKMAINVCDSSSKLFSLSCGSSLEWGYSYSYSYSHSYWSLHSLAYP